MNTAGDDRGSSGLGGLSDNGTGCNPQAAFRALWELEVKDLQGDWGIAQVRERAMIYGLTTK